MARVLRHRDSIAHHSHHRHRDRETDGGRHDDTDDITATEDPMHRGMALPQPEMRCRYALI